MKKWKLIKVLLKLAFNITLFVIAITSVYEFLIAELIVDKIHYGFMLTFILIFLCDENNNNNKDVATS